MKRTLIPTLIIGLVAAAVVSLLHAYGFLFRAEFAITEFISHHSSIDRLMVGNIHYVFVTVLAFGAAWTTIEGARRGWAWWLILVLLVELAVVSWVCALYHVFFQPLPSMLAVALSLALAYAYHFVTRGSRARLATEMFSAHLSRKQLDQVIRSKFGFKTAGSSHETTVVICDIANKHDLADDLPPETVATMLDRFVHFATEAFLTEGAYIYSADGEGVVAIFGFPARDSEHGAIAAGAALRLLEKFGELRKSTPDLFGNADLHFGISSGVMVAARLQNDHKTGIVPMGEPLEMARRFCQANRVYGSRILLGPQSFELAEKKAIARPIDFLGGANSHDRFEIYELLGLVEGAKPEEVMRRDSFWNGVVYYRERRWEEAYAEFQKAWGDNGHEDGPLQLYLRRLEPLVLHLTGISGPSELAPTI